MCIYIYIYIYIYTVGAGRRAHEVLGGADQLLSAGQDDRGPSIYIYIYIYICIYIERGQ